MNIKYLEGLLKALEYEGLAIRYRFYEFFRDNGSTYEELSLHEKHAEDFEQLYQKEKKENGYTK